MVSVLGFKKKTALTCLVNHGLVGPTVVRHEDSSRRDLNIQTLFSRLWNLSITEHNFC